MFRLLMLCADAAGYRTSRLTDATTTVITFFQWSEARDGRQVYADRCLGNVARREICRWSISSTSSMMRCARCRLPHTQPRGRQCAPGAEHPSCGVPWIGATRYFVNRWLQMRSAQRLFSTGFPRCWLKPWLSVLASRPSANKGLSDSPGNIVAALFSTAEATWRQFPRRLLAVTWSSRWSSAT
jgi:hypothetical protein